MRWGEPHKEIYLQFPIEFIAQIDRNRQRSNGNETLCGAIGALRDHLGDCCLFCVCHIFRWVMLERGGWVVSERVPSYSLRLVGRTSQTAGWSRRLCKTKNSPLWVIGAGPEALWIPPHFRVEWCTYISEMVCSCAVRCDRTVDLYYCPTLVFAARCKDSIGFGE